MDAKCAAILLQDGWYVGRRRVVVYSDSLPPDRRREFRDAKCAARLLRDGWCIGRERRRDLGRIFKDYRI